MTVTAAWPRPNSRASGMVSASTAWTADSEELDRLGACRSGIGGFAISGCIPPDRHARAPQLDEIVDGADQLQFPLRADQAAQGKAAEAAPLDLADDGLHRDLPLGVDGPATFSAQPASHPVRRAQSVG